MTIVKTVGTHIVSASFLLGSLLAFSSQASAADYENALKDVEQVQAVFDVTSPSAEFANAVFLGSRECLQG